MNKFMRGFTLIELMIVIAILAIAIAIGYPSYRDQVIKSRRSEGMGELLELADRLERYYSDQGTYATATLGDGSLDTDVHKDKTKDGYYNLAITAQDAIAYTITAAPTSKGNQDDDKCGTFTYVSDGTRTVSGSIGEDACNWK